MESLLVGQLMRQHRLVSRTNIHQHILILVRSRRDAAVGLKTGTARAHWERHGNPSEEHHHTADCDYSDECKQTEDYYDVLEGDTTFSRTIRPGSHPATADRRVPHPVSLHTEHCCPHSRLHVRQLDLTHAVAGGTCRASRGPTEIK
jgi:hypothetical protein